MDLAKLRAESQPFYVEFYNQSMSGRFNVGVITLDWQLEFDRQDEGDADEIGKKFVEAIESWDAMDFPLEYDSDAAFSKGDIISFGGSAYKVLEFDKDYDAPDGEAPSPDQLPARGERAKYGPFLLENLGSAEEKYPAPLTVTFIRRRLPAPLLMRVLSKIMENAQGDVDDAKKGE
jgi:hypothetical protein